MNAFEANGHLSNCLSLQGNPSCLVIMTSLVFGVFCFVLFFGGFVQYANKYLSWHLLCCGGMLRTVDMKRSFVTRKSCLCGQGWTCFCVVDIKDLTMEHSWRTTLALNSDPARVPLSKSKTSVFMHVKPILTWLYLPCVYHFDTLFFVMF